MSLYYQTCLQHHGILGMKWGKRQGPPYPLDSADHSASEKKAGWEDSLDSSSGSKKEEKAAKKAAKKEVKKEKQFNKMLDKDLAKNYNAAIKIHNEELKRINNKEEYKNANLNDYTSPIAQKYIKEVGDSWKNIYKDIIISDLKKYDPSVAERGEQWFNDYVYMYDFYDYLGEHGW